jgi:hypothetical protein
MESHFEVIAAFLDGERVDPAALTNALATPEGRAYLVDVVALRELTSDANAQPFVGRLLTPPRASRTRWLSAAAALVLTAGAYLAGHHAGLTGRPGEPARSTTTSTSAPPAPAPTRVIHFQPGVDWKEATGGH